LADSRLVVINAARTESLLVGLTEFGDLGIALHVMTDDGSRGIRGMATDLLLTLLEAEQGRGVPKTLYACGPMPMLRSVGEIAIRLGLPCQVSIETSMPCGIGLCQGCATQVRDDASSTGFSYALACVDGPVFEARDLVWE
jgi:dihydroorotate dehydrogenase electron transfer subunit